VAIARALAQDPRLVLADEPTGNLDTATAETVLRLLRRTVDEFGLSIVLATHSNEGLAMADRVISLRDGRMT
jgi:ABC-type lipoprotein export system ATPase subunit